ncbi:MAG: LamG-like jellyroll fold domain-containing protein [Nitrosotalea sp.]
MKAIIAVLLISMLASSSASADAPHFSGITTSYHPSPETVSNVSHHLALGLHDGVNMKTNGESDQNSQTSSSTEKKIELYDVMAIDTNDLGSNAIMLVKQTDDRKIIMERLYNFDRIRGKELSASNMFSSDLMPSNKLLLPLYIDSLQFSADLGNNAVFANAKINENMKTVFGSVYLIDYGLYYKTFDYFEDVVAQAHSVVDTNPTAWLPVILLSFILFRTEKVKLGFTSRQFSSLCLFVLVSSSIAVMPLSASPFILQNAFADTGDSNDSQVVSTKPNSTLSLPLSNDTTPSSVLSNSTSQNSVPSNSTSQNSVPSNTTITNHKPNSTLSLSLSNSTSLNTLSNATSLNSTLSNATSLNGTLSNATSLNILSNATSLNSTLSNATSLNMLSNSTSLNMLSNSTSLNMLSNSTILNSTLTNATSLNILTNSTSLNSTLSNATSLNILSNATSLNGTLSNATSLNILSNTTSLNSTLTNTTRQNIPSNPPSPPPIPPPAPSLQFNASSGDISSKGDVELDNSTNQTSLKLTGQGYVTQNGTQANDLSELAISAWVKPDYSQGSPQFTVVSKENSFILAVNNNMPTAKKAVFSVFDGIKWNTIESTSTIPEDWTYLVATFNGSSITLYVNGKQESVAQLTGVPTIEVNGNIATKTVDNLSSDADVVIGAYYNTIRQNPSNEFSGNIDSVNLYKSLLSQDQIEQAYNAGTARLETENITQTNPAEIANATGILHSTLVSNSTVFGNATISINDTVSTNGTVSTNDTALNGTALNDTAMPVTPLLTNTKNSYLLSESPEFKFQYFSDSDIQKLDNKTTGLPIHTRQNGKWAGKGDTINIQLLDPSGRQVSIGSAFEKVANGKFDIKLDSARQGLPGVYTIKTTLVRDGKTYTTSDQFAWGLVSLNTNKSIYRPGETANFTIVVLDNGGHSVCNANIAMNIKDPLYGITTISSGDGITPDSQCGLYDAQYTTKSEGNYTVNLTAQTTSGTAYFGTSFLVQNSYPFDIVRTADSKIDPKTNPDSFNVRLDVVSYANATNISIQESVPSSFNVITDASVQTVGDSKILTWNKDLIANKTSVQYTYSVPLQYPQLYALGPAKITYDSQTFTEARPWFVAVDPPVHIETNGISAATKATSVTVTGLNGAAGNTTHRLVVVGIALRSAKTVTSVISGATGTSCATSPSVSYIDAGVGVTTSDSTPTITQIYYLKDNRTDTFDICVTLSGSTRVYAVAAILSGVNTSGNPIGSHWGFTGTIPAVANTVFTDTMTNSTSGDTVFDMLGITDGTGTGTVTAASPSVLLDTGSVGATGTSALAISDSMQNATSSSVGMGWSTSGADVSETYAHSLISIKHSPAAYSQSLTDSVPITDQSVSTSRMISTSLTDSVPITDQSVSTSRMLSTSLTDSVPITDQAISTSRMLSTTLTDSVPITDQSVSTSRMISTSLTDSVPITDPSVSTSRMLSTSLTDSVPITDPSVSTSRMLSKSLSDSVPITDQAISTSRMLSTTLTDSVPITDQSISTAQAISQSLTDSVPITDQSSTAQTISQSLTDSVPITDTTSKLTSVPLSDSVPITDQAISTSKVILQSLTDSVPITDTTSKLISTSLSDSVPITDQASTSRMISTSLADSVPITDTTSKLTSIPLSDSVPITDQAISVSSVILKSLSDSVPITDQSISTAHAISWSLSDSVPITDQASTSRMISTSLSDSVPISDTTSKLTSVPLSDSVPITDQAISTSKAIVQSLTDSVPITDTTSKLTSIPLSDSVPITDQASTSRMISTSLADSVPITDQSSTAHAISTSLTDSVPITDPSVSASTAISQSLSDSVPITDQAISTAHAISTSLSDSLPITDQVSTEQTISRSLSDSVPITDTASKLTSTSLADSVPITDPTISTSKAIVQSLTDSVPITDTASKLASVPLSDSVPITDQSSTTQTIIRSLSDSVPITDQASTSRMISKSLTDSVPITGSATGAKNLASNQQLVENSQTQATASSDKPQLVVVSSNAELSNVTVPYAVSTSSINYSSISTTSGSTNTAQISNPVTITKYDSNNSPLVKITIPADTISGTSWDGVFDMPAVQTGQNLVLPTPSGQTSTVNVVFQMGSSTPLTFDNAVRMVITGQAGQHVGYYHSSTNTVTEITTLCTDDTQATNNNLPAGGDCKINVGSDLVIWTLHSTGFATWSSSVSSTSTASGSSGGGAGAVGVGAAGAESNFTSLGTSGTSGISGAIPAPVLKIDGISYNLCQNDTVKILVEYSDSAPAVILRTSMSGTVQAAQDTVQPFAQQNQNSTIQKMVYVAQVDPKETSFEAMALQAADNNVYSVGDTVNVSACQQSINYANPGATAEQAGAPGIFDVMLQAGNGTEIPSSVQNQFTSSQPVKVSAIINSPTPPKVQLRFVPSGSSVTAYSTVDMDVIPLQISNTTYTVSGTIPADMMQAPAISYWVDAQNTAGKTTDSAQYTIGVKPAYDIAGTLEMDIHPVMAEGTAGSPVAYFTNNGTGPIYGSVSLVVDGSITYTSPSQVFGTGQTAVDLKWDTVSAGKLQEYKVRAVANFYDKSFETSASQITTFPSVQSVALPQLSTLSALNENNNTIAQPSVLYSSFNDKGTMRYDVTAPGGICVIGGSADCLVQKSTFGLAGNLKSVTIGDQIYRVRYSGPDSPLERFSITSVDPIVGPWHVGVDLQQGLVPQAHAAQDVFLKIQYRSTDSSLVTLFSP